ncbi:phosphoglycerate dehydrogenase [Defluviitalea saccharophila]|uniref:Phosphoglycerate dehydrogenase n=1 Tax=Defluviitalea saccharophila TaxID=879970 RepID=A0ABZ2Y584_9FIRM|nr:phosphoglycerate dehydrogenase [Candidatus Epulonipiscium sp.]
MYKIQTLNNISEKGLELLPKDTYEVSNDCTNPDGILVRSAKMHGMELPASLKAIARAGAGVNNIPVEECSEKGIVVFNTPGANANGVKELVLAGLLLSSRKIVEGIQWTKSLKGQGSEVPKLVEKGKSEFAGPEILGKKLGVIGLGAIGVLVANAAHSLGMDVQGYDPYMSIDAAWGLSRSVHRAVSLESLLSECDYITVHVPLLDETKNMLNKEKFALMKKGVRILNFSRGELVNNTDLIEAIKEGIVAAYVTDFPSEELIDVENIIAIPHLGASTPESEENCAMMAAEQLRNYLEHGNIKNSVNFPDCEMVRTTNYRTVVAHKNIRNMVGQITTILAHADINIMDMMNKSKKDWAYTVIDSDKKVEEDIVAKIKAIDGVVAVRTL